MINHYMNMLLLFALLPLSTSTLLRRGVTTPQQSIEDLVQQEMSKGTSVASKRSPLLSVYDPKNCIVHGRNGIDAVTEIGGGLIRKRNFHAGINCIKNALQSWYAGIQQNPAAYLGNAGPSQEDLRIAVKHLQFQGLPDVPGDGGNGDTSHSVAGEEEDHPQIPPQLLYMHKLRSKQAAMVEAIKNDNSHSIAPRMVKFRLGEKEKQKQKRMSKIMNGGDKANDAITEGQVVNLANLSPEEQVRELAMQTIRKQQNKNT